MVKKKALWRLLFILIFFAGVAIHFFLPRLIVEVRSSDQTIEFTDDAIFKNDGLKGRYLNFESHDGLNLSSYLTYSSLDTLKGTIILLHGIRSGKVHFAGLSNRLAAQGYHAIALDLRGHGESEGRYCTFGVKEKEDVKQLIDTLMSLKINTGPIGVWGQSLGGAVGLQAMGYDKRIKFGIIESTFSNFRSITHDYTKRLLGFNLKPLTNYLIYRAGKMARFTPDEASPIMSCKAIDQPVLLVHGNEDDRINIKYAKANFSNLNSPYKQYFEIEGANHINVWQRGGAAYFETVFDFMAQLNLK